MEGAREKGLSVTSDGLDPCPVLLALFTFSSSPQNSSFKSTKKRLSIAGCSALIEREKQSSEECRGIIHHEDGFPHRRKTPSVCHKCKKKNQVSACWVRLVKTEVSDTFESHWLNFCFCFTMSAVDWPGSPLVLLRIPTCGFQASVAEKSWLEGLTLALRCLSPEATHSLCHSPLVRTQFHLVKGCWGRTGAGEAHLRNCLLSGHTAHTSV